MSWRNSELMLRFRDRWHDWLSRIVGNLFSCIALCPLHVWLWPGNHPAGPFASGVRKWAAAGPWPWLDASRCGDESSRNKGMEMRCGRIAVLLRRAACAMRQMRCFLSEQTQPHWPPLWAPSTASPRYLMSTLSSAMRSASYRWAPPRHVDTIAQASKLCAIFTNPLATCLVERAIVIVTCHDSKFFVRC